MRFAVLLLVSFAPSIAAGQDHPRRMLVIHVGNPIYLNPLTSKATTGPERVRDSAERLAAAIRVPTTKENHQLFVFSDVLPPPDDQLLTKAAILGAVRAFCETSRAQDRILLYLAGHAFEKEGKAYFAPIDGDPRDPATLVPVVDLYSMVRDCKAAQKVVIWDVSRRNPIRPRIRPDSGPMTEALARALSAAPPSIQVVLPCTPGEFSLEYSEPKGDARLFAGSALADSLRQAFEDSANKTKAQPGDAIAIAAVFPAVEQYVASAANAYRVKQTTKLIGHPPKTSVAADPGEAPAGSVKMLAPATGSTREARSILNELALPPLAGDGPTEPLPAQLFPVERLKSYEADATIDEILKNPDRYSMRVAVIRGLQAIRDSAPGADPRAARPILAVAAPLTERIKKTVLDAQGPVALALVKLEAELEKLTALGSLRVKETPRWQANYDYTLAQIQLRIAVMNEYNLALGHVRTETLPELDKGMAGWRLVHSEKMLSRKDVRELAAAGQHGLRSLAATRMGTPWEVLAKRALLTPPGLRWEPQPP